MRGVKSLTLLVILATAVLANPPPGELLGTEIPIALWAVLLGLALLGGLVTILAAQTPWSYVGLGLMALPHLGAIHDLGELGFWATGAGALAFVIHLEALTFARRRSRWATKIGDDSDALERYESAYRSALAKLAAVITAGVGLLIGAFWLLRMVAPASLAESIEARHPEGVAAFTLLLALLAAALWLLAGEDTAEPSTEDQPGASA